jgi:hypothetical protein
MITQPDGLRTLTLLYLPGLWRQESTANAPVALGSTMFPVIGAIAAKTRPSPKAVYSNPSELSEEDLKASIYAHLEQKPANIQDVTVRRTMVRLTSQNLESAALLWMPLKQELRLQREWIQSHNLDLPTFQEFSHLLEGPCRE